MFPRSRFPRIFFGMLLALGLLSPAFAQHQHEMPVTTVKAAIALPDDTPVRLEGRIERELGDEKYLFRDETGEIVVEIDDDLPQPVPGSRLLIDGEVDKDASGSVKIEAKALRLPS